MDSATLHGLYLYDGLLDIHKPTGIDNKVLDQIDSFRHYGIDCSLILLRRPSNALLRGIRNRFPFCDSIRWPKLEEIDDKAAFIYIRTPPFFSYVFIRFIRNVKAHRPNTMIFLEIPTWPIECISCVHWTLKIKNHVNIPKLKDCVDAIFYMGNASECLIYGCQAIHLQNGISLKRVLVNDLHEPEGVINLVCASKFSAWHGMDRVIKGISNYLMFFPNRKRVILHLIGDGPEIDNYKKLVCSLRVQENVIFHGFCTQDEMADIFKECSIAISSLGRHRSGHSISSALKEREYLARGIPFIYSCDVDLFEGLCPFFCMRVPEDDSPIDIEEVCRFHDKLFQEYSPRELPAIIRNQYASEISMDAAMKPVCDIIVKR